MPESPCCSQGIVIRFRIFPVHNHQKGSVKIKMVKRPLFFYGWVIVSISIVGTMLVYGTRHSFSVFFPPILDEFHWSRGSTAFMLSLNLLIYGLTAPIAGRLSDRWKPRWVMGLGVVTLGLATACCAFANELWHFYLLFGFLMPIGSAFTGLPVLGPAVANWFVKKRGLAIGLAQIGGGLSFTYGLFVEYIISVLGWRCAYFVIAGVLMAVLLPLYILPFNYQPENKGLKALGSTEPYDRSTISNPVSDSYTMSQAVRTSKLWLLIGSFAFYWGIGCYLVLAHQVKFAQDVGYGSTFAASIFALFGIFVAAGQLSSGMSDWIGREKTLTIASILSISGLIALILVRDTSQPWLLYLYAICFGYGAGLSSPTIYAGMADIFYGKHFGSIGGLMLTGFAITGVLGPWLGGYIYDISGSYTSPFLFCIACFGLSSVLFWVAAPRKAAQL